MRMLIAAAALVLAGCAAPPEPEPTPAGKPFWPTYMEQLQHPPSPVCAPQDLAELMLGCD